MQPYQIIITDRAYESWDLFRFDSDISEDKLHTIEPLKLKLFSHDVVHRDGTLIHSYVRREEIPGVLILTGNRSYGRTENGKRLLYQCIPHNKELPIFLIPFELKLGFSKDIRNKYVVFRFDHWDQDRPRGILTESLGDVDSMPAYYEYNLYCKSIHDSIANFNQKTRALFKPELQEEYHQAIMNNPNFSIVKDNGSYIFSIDPDGCTDIDDAISIVELDNCYHKVGVYIANVVVWMEQYDLWNQIVDRLSTIYLPDKRRTMLPVMLSENLCSLLEKQNRFAFRMEVIIDNDGNVIGDPIFTSVYTHINKNYAYEEPKLLNNQHYRRLLEVTRKMRNDIVDSHDLVEFWMLFMNTQAGRKLTSMKTGIFRTITLEPSTLPTNMISILNYHGSGKYIRYSEDTESMYHKTLELNSYAHITSPIRRLVDLVNQTIFVCKSDTSITFIRNWLSRIDVINRKTRSIRKVQSNCELITHCHNDRNAPGRIYSGIVFEKRQFDDRFEYNVFLDTLRVFSKVKTTADLQEYTKYNFTLFYFENEHDSHGKIRVKAIV